MEVLLLYGSTKKGEGGMSEHLELEARVTPLHQPNSRGKHSPRFY